MCERKSSRFSSTMKNSAVNDTAALKISCKHKQFRTKSHCGLISLHLSWKRRLKRKFARQ